MQFAAPAAPAATAPACPPWLRNAVTDEVAASPAEWQVVLDGLELFFVGDPSYKGLFHEELYQANDYFGSMAKSVDRPRVPPGCAAPRSSP